ncbi:MAG: hypothetical protein DRG78_06260 [Epsilonproteobacteria bacterium]|nr:MAG: hypothetical protein DRG78_06260 [Campylobacterota bacterium]
MLKRIIILIGSCQLSLMAMPVTDLGSYAYYVSMMNQTIQLIDNATKQIESLGGIRSSVDDMKRDVYNTKDTLEGSVENVKSSMKRLNKATKSVEVKSLFSMRRDSIGNSSGGIMYGDISEKMNYYFKAADQKIIDAHGGRENMKKPELKLYKLNKALGKTTLNGFKSVMGTKIDYEEVKNTRRVEEYVKKVSQLTRKDAQQLALSNVHKTYNDLFNPSEKVQEEQAEDEARINSLVQGITASKDLMQQNKTTNLLLAELLRVTIKQYKSAVEYRNGIVSLYLQNSNNEKFLELVNKNKELQNVRENSRLTQKILLKLNKNNRLYENLKKADPNGTGFRL